MSGFQIHFDLSNKIVGHLDQKYIIQVITHDRFSNFDALKAIIYYKLMGLSDFACRAFKTFCYPGICVVIFYFQRILKFENDSLLDKLTDMSSVYIPSGNFSKWKWTLILQVGPKVVGQYTLKIHLMISLWYHISINMSL